MRAHVFLLLLTALFLKGEVFQPVPLNAQQTPPTHTAEAYAAAVETGRMALIDFRLNEAEKIFQELTVQAADSVYPYHLYASVAFWRAMVDDTDSLYEQFYKRSDRVLEHLKKRSTTRWNQFLYAEANLQRAVVLGKTEHFLRAAWVGRKAYQTYTLLAKEHPAFYEAYMGLGLSHVMLGSLPDTYRWILARFGLKGGVEKGIRELETAANYGGHKASEAQAVLALIDIILNQEKKAGTQRLAALYQTHPNSLIFAHLYGYGLLATHQAKQAEQVFRRAVAKTNDPRYHSVEYVRFYLAEALFAQNRFGPAADYYRQFLDRFNGQALVALAQLRAGLALEMQGQYSEARRFYKLVKSERGFDTDRYARRIAQQHMDRPLSAVEQDLLIGENHYAAGRYHEGAEKLLPIYEQKTSAPKVRAEAAYWLGRIRQAQGRSKEALSFYATATQQPGDSTARWAPWSRFYMGMIYAELGNDRQARRVYEEVLAYEHTFDFKNALEQRVHTALDHL